MAPYLNVGQQYNRDTLVSDLLVATIVTIMLIPQGLAYAWKIKSSMLSRP